MKKYILATLILFIPCVTYALTMCARDDSLVVSLTTNGAELIEFTSNQAEFTWSANFNFGTILGEATCLSKSEAGVGSYAGNITNESGQIIPSSIPKGLTGSYNGDARAWCWCRMTHPAISRWVYKAYAGNAPWCTLNCAVSCKGHWTSYFSTVGRID